MMDNKNTVELLLQLANKYTLLYSQPIQCGSNSLTFSELQVLECVIKHQDQHMREVAERMGVSKAAVSKSIKKMMNKGYIHLTSNIFNHKYKDISITDEGLEVYKDFKDYIYENLLNEFYKELSDLSESSQACVQNLLKNIDKFLDTLKQ